MSLPDSIAAPLRAALEARGFAALTPVQAAMLDEGARDADLLVSAQTGSGKTVAFGIALAPLLLAENNRMAESNGPSALAIAPTRELAMQVRRELEWLYAGTGARFASCIGGMDYRRELRALEQGADIVIGTPGRLRDHLTRRSLDISELRAVVLDEADEMLDLGFREDLEFILDAAPVERRTLMFSATVAAPIAKLAKSYQKDAVRLALSQAGDRHVDITYHLMPVHPNERDHAVINTLLWFDSQNTIIFCQTREAVRHLSTRLINRGFSVVSLSGELSQAERTNALQSMRDGRARICVATDVAARGIDLPNLDLVIHADMPTNQETLLHRSGRTGRAGRKGEAVVIAPWHRRRSAERVLQGARVQANVMMPPVAEAVDQRQMERMLGDSMLSQAVGEDEQDTVAMLVAAHTPEQIAAAWIRQYRQTLPSPEAVTEDNRPAPRKEVGERPQERFTGGVWFSLSLGRKARAEPRWILPIICKAGGVTRTDVGSIRILENETRFEISQAMASAYRAQLAKGVELEKGARITAFEGNPMDGDEGRREQTDRPPSRKGPKPDFSEPRTGDFKKKKWKGSGDFVAPEAGATEGDWRGKPAKSYATKSDKPYAPKSDKPYAGKSSKPYAPKSDKPYAGKSDKPYAAKSEKFYGDKFVGKPAFAGKGDAAPKGDAAAKPAKKPHRKGNKPNG